MLLDAIHGHIERRILLNYRVRPEALEAVLPLGFRPILKDGWGIAGVCLIRLKGTRAGKVPNVFGKNSEYAAHRIAVTWDQDGEQKEGVYIPKRDTSSRWNATFDGRIFPGNLEVSRFESSLKGDRHKLKVVRQNGGTLVEFDGSVAPIWSKVSLFKDLKEASDFFTRGAIEYSAGSVVDRFQGVELRPQSLNVHALAVIIKHSSYWEDRTFFPKGTSEFDSAMILQSVDHEWRHCPDLSLQPDGNLSTRR